MRVLLFCLLLAASHARAPSVARIAWSAYRCHYLVLRNVAAEELAKERGSEAMPPNSSYRIKSIVDQEFRTMLGDEFHGVTKVTGYFIAEEVVKIQSHPAWLNSFATTANLRFEFVTTRAINS